MSARLLSELHEQYLQHPGWSYQLHADNLAALVEEDSTVGRAVSYSTVRRCMKANDWRKRRQRRDPTPGMLRAEQRLQKLEVRSYEASFVHQLWHFDFHEGKRKVSLLDGSLDTAQPIGILDDYSCTSQPWKGQVLAFHLMPGMKELWWNQLLSDYVDRWVEFGTWTQPDPCAPLDQGGGPNPARPGECVLDPDLTLGSTFDDFECQAGRQCGRFPDLHGTETDGGLKYSDFINAMWDAYR